MSEGSYGVFPDKTVLDTSWHQYTAQLPAVDKNEILQDPTYQDELLNYQKYFQRATEVATICLRIEFQIYWSSFLIWFRSHF